MAQHSQKAIIKIANSTHTQRQKPISKIEIDVAVKQHGDVFALLGHASHTAVFGRKFGEIVQ